MLHTTETRYTETVTTQTAAQWVEAHRDEILAAARAGNHKAVMVHGAYLLAIENPTAGADGWLTLCVDRYLTKHIETKHGGLEGRD